jgi:hypothetical protein
MSVQTPWDGAQHGRDGKDGGTQRGAAGEAARAPLTPTAGQTWQRPARRSPAGPA